MKWSARIDKRSEVDISGMMTYTVAILGDDEAKISGVEISGTPDAIQQIISEKVTAFAQSFELADTMPNVGDVLTIIGSEDETLSLPSIEGVGIPDDVVVEEVTTSEETTVEPTVTE